MSRNAQVTEAVDALVRRTQRFSAEAYYFTLEALSYTLQRMAKKGRKGHISGGELLEGIRDFARTRYGFLGRTVFESWGLKSSADFGDLVFDLADAELLAKQESDKKTDFEGGFEFAEAFEGVFIHD